MFGGFRGMKTSTQVHGTRSKPQPTTLQFKLNPDVLHSPELEVFFWKFNKYLGRFDLGPPPLIPVTDILSQACRLRLIRRLPAAIDEDDNSGLDSDEEEDDDRDVLTEVYWVTAGLTRVCVHILKVKLTHRLIGCHRYIIRRHLDSYAKSLFFFCTTTSILISFSSIFRLPVVNLILDQEPVHLEIINPKQVTWKTVLLIHALQHWSNSRSTKDEQKHLNETCMGRHKKQIHKQ
jgi:hypothetical protein